MLLPIRNTVDKRTFRSVVLKIMDQVKLNKTTRLRMLQNEENKENVHSNYNKTFNSDKKHRKALYPIQNAEGFCVTTRKEKRVRFQEACEPFQIQDMKEEFKVDSQKNTTRDISLNSILSSQQSGSKMRLSLNGSMLKEVPKKKLKSRFTNGENNTQANTSKITKKSSVTCTITMQVDMKENICVKKTQK